MMTILETVVRGTSLVVCTPNVGDWILSVVEKVDPTDSK